MMANNVNERNQYQIIRKDARNCFVETKSDSFSIGKVHLEFATYDSSRPAGQRQTNHVHIYIDVAEFMNLANFILHGSCHTQMSALKQKGGEDINRPLYQSLGGTSAERLAQRGKSRADGKSLSRNVKLFVGKKADYLFCAESGPGETDAKGLIVPRYGNTPEQRVSVGISMAHINELMICTIEHYRAWLSWWYIHNYQTLQRSNGSVNGNNGVAENGNNGADDMQIY